MPKSIFTSWTFWFGFCQLATAGVGFFSGILDQQAALALAVTGLGSIGFRLKTTQPVSLN